MKNSKLYKDCIGSLIFLCQPVILQLFPFVIACKELKVEQIAQINQLFQLLN